MLLIKLKLSVKVNVFNELGRVTFNLKSGSKGRKKMRGGGIRC